MALLRRHTPLVEPVSIDEAFLDVSSVRRFWPDPVGLARELKSRIRAELALTASVGLAPCKFLAKLASDMQKPDGLTVVPTDPAAIEAFLAPLPVRRIWGVGPVLEAALQKYGWRTIRDLQALPESRLATVVGANAAHHILELAHGRDTRAVVTEYEEKSISAETTFDEDCSDAGTVRQALIEQTERVGRRLRDAGKLAGTGQIKVRFGDFRTITRQRRFSPRTCRDRDLLACALELYAAEKVREPVRLVGFGVTSLREPRDGEDLWQPLLFGAPEAATPPADDRLDRAVDALRQRYGNTILKRGTWPKPGT
jgi:DNA polymerase-4